MTTSTAGRTFKTFAIAGGLTSGYSPVSAGIGSFIARALHREGARDIRILGRGEEAIDSPVAQEMRALGITPLAISYDQPESLRSALEGVEVVVSTIGGSALAGEAQFELAKACHATETVKLFVSSEFGTNTTLVPPTSPLYGKQAFQNRVEKELPGLQTLRIFNGAFADCANPLIITDKNDEIHVVGEGKAPMSFTSRSDVASFLAYILTHQPPAQLLAHRTLPIESSRVPLLTLAHLLQARNPNAKIIHHPYADATQASGGNAFLGWLRVNWDKGEAVVTRGGDWKEGLKNGMWEGGKWSGVETFF